MTQKQRGWAVHLVLALVVYAPILRAHPGIVGADTKSYLYIDPAKLLSRAPWMWDPNVGMGTLTHQNIGYLFPMGPWYWIFERIGAPDWVAQRLWLATVMFAAAAGVLFLCRTWQLRGVAGPAVAAAAYALSPYVLDYSARISVILLPWAALPWLIALADRALKRGGWRHPAIFGLVVLAIGGVNATALVFAGLGPVLWILFAALGTREVGLGRAVATVAKIGVLTTLVSLWWASGLAVQGKYGIPVLRYTETVETVARTSLASEVLRGLGYWFFYGNDVLGPWIEPASDYTQRVWLIAAGFALPVLALTGAAVLRWRYRAYCICLLAVGVLIAVGAHPYDAPSPLGKAFKALASSSTVGLALRSTPRAVPLVALGLALLLGAGVSAIADHTPRLSSVAAVAVVALVLAGIPPLFSGEIAVGEHIKRPEHIPSYWPEAAAYLDGRGDATRVLELPGTDFASYRWGNTIDPITPYLMDRPYVARELIPYGSPASADLLNAFDRRLQEGTFEPASLAPFARLVSAGDIVLRNDLQSERYRTPRPRVLAARLTPRPDGIQTPRGFGPAVAPLDVAARGGIDETELAVRPGGAEVPRVSVFGVSAPRPIVRAEPAAGGMIVAGDGEGLVELAAAGLLGEGRVRYAASLGDGRAWDQALASEPTLVLTDSNRLRGRRWGTVRENSGFTEQPGAGSLTADPSDARLELFPQQRTASQTVAQQRGVRSIRATHYGNPVSFTPEDRASNAADGDLSTAWRVGAFADVRGERLRLELNGPVETDHITITQALTGPRNRYITRAKIRLDGGDAIDVALSNASRERAGQQVAFPRRTVSTVEVEVVDTNTGAKPRYDGSSGVGIAELDVSGVRVDEVLRLPTDLLSTAGDRSAGLPLTVLLARQRSNPADPSRADEEPSLKRTFNLPVSRSFAVAVTARLAATLPDDAIDRLLGWSGPVASSDSRLPGDLGSRASSALDGDPRTAWQPGLLDQIGHWIEIDAGRPITFDHLDLSLVADGRHSVPTRVRIDIDGRGERFLDLPAVTDDRQPGSTKSMPLAFEAVTGQRIRLTVEDVRPVATSDFFSGAPLDLPVGIAEIAIPGLEPIVRRDSTLQSACRDDLLEVDGRPIPVRLRGEAAAAVGRDGLTAEACEPGLTLGPGDHDIRSAAGTATGLDVDRVVLSSPRPGGTEVVPDSPPAVRVTGSTRTSFQVRVESSGRPFWLVLGQSHNDGWRATSGSRVFGRPQLVDGYANGWLIDPGPGARTMTVELNWAPQRTVWAGLAVSAVGALACLAIVAWTTITRRRRRQSGPERAQNDDVPAFAPPPRPHPVTAAVVAVLFGLAAGPFVGAAAAAVVLLAAFVRPARWFLAFSSAIALAVAGAYVAVQQARYRYPPDFAWPVNTERAHLVGWFAVALVVATGFGWRAAEETR